MVMKIVPSYITDNCKWCHYSSGLETHSEDYATCNHETFNKYIDGKAFEDTSGNIPLWCPLKSTSI